MIVTYVGGVKNGLTKEIADKYVGGIYDTRSGARFYYRRSGRFRNGNKMVLFWTGTIAEWRKDNVIERAVRG